jgi:hypothetical protein
MMEGDLSEGKEQSVKDLVDEEIEMNPRKTKKKGGEEYGWVK